MGAVMALVGLIALAAAAIVAAVRLVLLALTLTELFAWLVVIVLAAVGFLLCGVAALVP